MLVIMETDVKESTIEKAINYINENGLKAHMVVGYSRIIISIIGDKLKILPLNFEALDGVEKTVSISAPYKLVSREFRSTCSIIDVGGIKIGAGNPVIIAGPCAVESRKQLFKAAKIVKQGGAQFLRGGAFKPRTSPYAFQGLEEEGLKYLFEIGKYTGLKIVTEVTDIDSIQLATTYSDILQIGARNMQNFRLLKEVGKINKPILIKRGIAATIDEWLNAAEYIVREGNDQIIFCERGIRTYETYTRNTLDISAVGIIKKLSHFPIIVDPSHGTGLWRLIKPMSMASIAAGADGLMIEMHPQPKKALCDGQQSLNPENYLQLMQQIKALSDFLKTLE